MYIVEWLLQTNTHSVSGGHTSCSQCFSVCVCKQVQAINESNRFEAEIRQEQEAKKKQAEEQKQRRAAFKQLQSAFK